MKKRYQIQQEALAALVRNGFNGTVVLSTGTGKSKVAIDAIKAGGFRKILITSPRTNLKDNWLAELHKWYFTSIDFAHDRDNFVLENIQTCYKWDDNKLKDFDLIIADEIHTMATPGYGHFLIRASWFGIPIIGLTATPDEDNEYVNGSVKRVFYEMFCPIIYRYTDSASDGIINKRRYIVVRYGLTDEYKVLAGPKDKQFIVGEAAQYAYLTEQIKKGQILMSRTGSSDWFRDAADWFWNGTGNSMQKNAARTYLQAIKYRKEFLWNLASSADMAIKLKERILYHTTGSNKVLLFSELTKQADKLTPYTIHSKNSEELNSKMLEMFNSSEIRELGSCNSLTLGLNLKGATHAIMESYNSSDVAFQQKAGRTDRLAVDDTAVVIFLVPKETQADEWFKKIMTKLEVTEYEEYPDLNFEL